MTLEKAINTALEYERRIRDLYREAAAYTSETAGKRIFTALENDEQRHVDYLKAHLAQLKKDGTLTVEKLTSDLPTSDTINQALDRLKPALEKEDRKMETQMLSKALQMEIETSRFYADLVAQLDETGQQLFAQFVAIENGHIDVVQAELDYLTQTGYWIDFKEFDMEGY